MNRAPITYKDSLTQVVEKMAEGDPCADLIARVVIEQSGVHRAEDLTALDDLNIRGSDIVLACIAYLQHVRAEYGEAPPAAGIYEELRDAALLEPRLGHPYDENDKPFRSNVAAAIYDFACGLCENKVQQKLLVGLLNDRKFLTRLRFSIRGLPLRSGEDIKLPAPYERPKSAPKEEPKVSIYRL